MTIKETLAALEAAWIEDPTIMGLAAFAGACADAYRTGQLVVAPSVEEVGKIVVQADAEAVEDEIEPTSREWGEAIATAILTSMGAKTDGN